MKSEDKAALKVGGTTALIVGAIALCIPNPASFAAVIWGSYRMGKQARDRVIQEKARQRWSSDQDNCI